MGSVAINGFDGYDGLMHQKWYQIEMVVQIIAWSAERGFTEIWQTLSYNGLTDMQFLLGFTFTL